MVRNGEYGQCRACGGDRTWIPFSFATDVCGSEQTAPMLRDEFGQVLSFRTSRERDQKMKRLGYEPCGDKVGGARNEDGFKQRAFSYRGQDRSKRTPAAPISRSNAG